MRLSSANNAFQRVEAIRRNRTLRLRYREVFVEGVRPINQAISHGWRLKSVWYEGDRKLSSWAEGVIASVPPGARFALTSDLMGRLSERADPSELVVVVELPAAAAEVSARSDLLLLVADRPGSPGNLGTIVRSCDALGAHALVITGHSADPFDPQAIRASMGSIFALPVLQVDGPSAVAELVRGLGDPQVVGTDSGGVKSIDEVDLRRPTVLVLGSEAEGMSYAFREMCDQVVRIPLVGAADSLNVAAAASIFLYEAARQRRGSSSGRG